MHFAPFVVDVFPGDPPVTTLRVPEVFTVEAYRALPQLGLIWLPQLVPTVPRQLTSGAALLQAGGVANATTASNAQNAPKTVAFSFAFIVY